MITARSPLCPKISRSKRSFPGCPKPTERIRLSPIPRFNTPIFGLFDSCSPFSTADIKSGQRSCAFVTQPFPSVILLPRIATLEAEASRTSIAEILNQWSSLKAVEKSVLAFVTPRNI